MKTFEQVRIGLQSYSLRNFSFEEAVSMTEELELKYIDAFPGHMPPEMQRVSEYKNLLKQHGVEVLAYGVVGLSNLDTQVRPFFEFAKEMGIEVLTADPEPDSFELLDKFVEQFGVAVAIHNHGPGHRYATIESIKKAISGHHKKNGACLDIGHLARADCDIVEAVHAFKERLHSVHLKDVNAQNKDVIVGTGVLPMSEFKKALEDVDFSGCLALEYEIQPDNPLPGIRKSLSYLEKLIEER